MSGPWYEHFFDRAYTQAWESAGAFAGTQAEVEGLASVLPAPTGLRILDVPCGFGRHSGPLQAMGHEVTGLDLSQDQLDVAAERNPGPTYLRGDMRTPPPGPFDVVTNLYSSFGYLGSEAADRSAMTAWRDVLAPGGVFVMTGNHRDRLAAMHVPEQAVAMGDRVVVEHPSVDWVAGVVHSRVVLPGGEERRFTVRLYSATEMVAMARAVGFSSVEVFGGFDGVPLSPQTRMVLLARTPS